MFIICNENHKQDIAIQYYVLKNSDVKITETTITHLIRNLIIKQMVIILS